MLGKFLLWRCQLDDNHSFLLGSVHVPSRILALDIETCINIMSKCEVIATELNLNIGYSEKLMKSMELKEGCNWLETLNKNKKVRLQYYSSRYFNFDINTFATSSPILTASILSSRLLDFDESDLILDVELWKEAIRLGLRSVGLESLSDREKLNNKDGMRQQLSHVIELIEHVSKSRKRYKKIIEYYNAGCLDVINKGSRKNIGKMRSLLLDDRNRTMANNFITLARKDYVFGIVGAAHLAGKNGILAILKRKGWIISGIDVLSET